MVVSYLGCKSALLPYIHRILDPLCDKHNTLFGDLFAGSGSVARSFIGSVKTIVASDLELYSYILNKALLQCVISNRLLKIIDLLNGKHLPLRQGLMYKNFSPYCNRMFFTVDNATRIDSIRIAISKMFCTHMINYKEFIFLLASLFSSVSKYVNSSGTMRAFLKSFSSRSLRPFILSPVHFNRSITGHHKVIKNDVLKVVKSTKFDIVYLDPPYNNCHYGGYYSLYNYLAIYNPKVRLTGVGIIKHYNKSIFGFVKTAYSAFSRLFDSINSKYILLSYSNNGILSLSSLINLLLSKNFHVNLYKVLHKNYRPSKRTNRRFVTEYLILIDTSHPSPSFSSSWLPNVK